MTERDVTGVPGSVAYDAGTWALDVLAAAGMNDSPAADAIRDAMTPHWPAKLAADRPGSPLTEAELVAALVNYSGAPGDTIARLVAEVRRLRPKFTAIPPTAEGWYWFRNELTKNSPVALMVTFGAGKWWALEGGFGTDGDQEPVDELGGEWAGPLEPPC